MILTYKECIELYGSDYKLKRAIKEKKLYQIEKGYYSDSELNAEIELIVAKFPKAIFAAESAYYYYGLTDVIPDYYHLATKRTDTRIKDTRIKQSFVMDEIFDVGKCMFSYQNINIPIYDKERLLIDLIRFKNKMPFDYYKEIINSYRAIINELDFFQLEEYASRFKKTTNIIEKIQLEVL